MTAALLFLCTDMAGLGSSIRSTNVYEERALGILEDDDENDDAEN
jgi:hypothetical protein